jgi:ribosome-binding factor A
MSRAKVYISVLPVPGAEDADAVEVVKGLTSAAGFLRHEIGQRLLLRMSPELKFIADDSIERGSRIIGVLNEIRGSEGHGETFDAD